MISITAPTFDPIGHVIIHPNSSTELENIERRVNRVKTLDGGAVVNDSGYSVSDRTFNINWSSDHHVFETLKRMTELYPRVIVSSHEGVFSAVPQRLVKRADESIITLLVMQKLS